MSDAIVKNQFVDVQNAREEEQRAVMQTIIDNAECPFCPANVRKYHKQPFLKEGTYWRLTTNQWPYPHTKHHFLLIYREHIEKLAQLDPAAGVELLQMCQWLEQEYQIPGGGLAMRFGDTDYSAGTVAHLHAQLLVPDIMAAEYDDKPVKVTIGKTWKKRGSTPS